jgi:hypothetical protein
VSALCGPHLVVLPFPAPDTCDQCGKACEPFATVVGWPCWDCVPFEYKCDEQGSPLPEPVLDAQDLADLRLIRERLGPDAERCDACGERRAPVEIYVVDGRWMCEDCQSAAARRKPVPPLENTERSEVSKGGFAPRVTISEDPVPEVRPSEKCPVKFCADTIAQCRREGGAETRNPPRSGEGVARDERAANEP